MSPISIRPATRRDIEALNSLARRSVAVLSSPFYNEAQIKSAAECITAPDSDLIDDGTLYVAFMGDSIVGCGGWSKRKKLYTGSDSNPGEAEYVDPKSDPARIRAFFVDPDHAGIGVAKAILNKCLEQAADAGFKRLELMATLPGVPFYRNCGFTDMGPAQLQLTDGSLLPCHRMGIDLSNM